MEQKKCSDCAFANFHLNNAPIGSGRRTFWCTRGRWCTYADEACRVFEQREYKKD